MRGLQPLEEILNSWRRCMSLGVVNSITSINTYIQEDYLQTLLNERKLLVSLFDDLGKELEELILSNNIGFMLMDTEGVLLKKIVAES